MLFVCVTTLYPFWYILVASFSEPLEVVRAGGMMLWLRGFSLYAYKEVFVHRLFLRSYYNTLVYLTFGVATNMFMTTLAAYALSVKGIKGAGAVMKVIVFTMFFGGG